MTTAYAAADIAAMCADFGATVVLDGASVRAVFDNAFELLGDEPGVSSTAPALHLAASSVPASPVGKAATVDAVAYTVTAHHPDGAGGAVLILRKA